jgi:hypothetical protein
MIVDATSLTFKWNTIHRLVNGNANWKPCIQFEFVISRIDKRVLKRETKMQPARARLAEHALTFDRRSWRGDVDDSNIIEAAPAGDIREHHPHDADGRLNNIGGASYISCLRDEGGIYWMVCRTLR